VPILVLVFDDENEDKIAAHGLVPEQVEQILDNPHIVVRNRKRRRAMYLVIGRDNGGRCIAVPVEPTNDPVTWRPVTAWPCKDHERSMLR
jgi:uncharacterized DUF497 family protein